MKFSVQGCGVALVTPFDEQGAIDFKSMIRLVDHVVDGGVDYIVLFGTTGESPTVSLQEKQEALQLVSKHLNGKVPIVIGFGSNNTTKLIEEMNLFDFTGASALLSVMPYYNKPNQDGMYMHYKMIAEHAPIPVVLYNVPGRTVVNMEPETTLRIARDCPNVMAIKEATDNMDQVMDLLYEKPASLEVVAGDDALALPIISMGACGVISVIANAYPKEFSKMVHATMNGNMEEARKYHYLILPIMHTLLKMGNPSGIKAVLHIKGLIQHVFRLPVHPVNEAKFAEISKVVEQTEKNCRQATL
ncbi:MAG: 4-hydroxy-tetrahydrodipicolinate synthase [Bacteroidetes bacterium GWF2_43_63]|nr:MAG: 4-hydroxy-tetrahydrodipicolinate synthase [Bacteroidetes bacterium GWE2_42_42]OFY56479.1 MAG: 4-hydroxy-tetrahydrodipicolinate synthase [Bacteroidetes bacterium GWF2_43_63]HBG71175.1 4-hydroxy-tetrahydrodipicolinate synthase [Bacteroidales bacterium]HCB61258.1 4-hydroxy-tetrahydrodipicolinate synthase [Bacteroidales bacterium]HCY23275.1 4-hydroxy-tetrahydrodipicolinate synthase [Bacteroidales bacterium]